jgi:hypothetical protein
MGRIANRHPPAGSSLLLPVMKNQNLALVLVLFAAPLMAGSLPSIGKQPWLTQYAAYEHKSFQFTVNSEGTGELVPMDAKGKPLSDKHAIKFLPVVEDVLPDGKVAAKVIQKDGWEAVTPAAVDPKTVTYRGTAGGNSRFEVTLEFDGKEVRAGGKLLDKGNLINPRFRLRVQVPNIYIYDKDPEKLAAKAEADEISLMRTDKKRVKLGVLKPLDAEAPEVGGPGVWQARIEMAGYAGNRLELDAGVAGSFEFFNQGIAPLSQGFSFIWKTDPAKDPEGKARLIVKVR